MDFDLIIFDCEGVLIDSELLACRTVAECLVEDGIAVSSDEIVERYTGISWAGMVADLERRHGPLAADFADHAEPVEKGGKKLTTHYPTR